MHLSNNEEEGNFELGKKVHYFFKYILALNNVPGLFTLVY